MADTTPGSALVTPVSFGSSNQTLLIVFDRIRIHTISWDYVANALNVFLDYGREDPLNPPFSEWFTKSQAHPIVNLGTPDTVILNLLTFNRFAGNHLTTLNATLTTAAIAVKENVEDIIFTALVNMNYFPLGVET